jgi:hypothetical protein
MKVRRVAIPGQPHVFLSAEKVPSEADGEISRGVAPSRLGQTLRCRNLLAMLGPGRYPEEPRSAQLQAGLYPAETSRKETRRCWFSSQRTSRTHLKLCSSVRRPMPSRVGWSRNTSGSR